MECAQLLFMSSVGKSLVKDESFFIFFYDNEATVNILTKAFFSSFYLIDYKTPHLVIRVG